jgi:quercetin dioxygenase-like cupin family protein
MPEFNPNTKSSAACVVQIKEVVEKAGLDPKKIITSRDAASVKLRTAMKCTNVPEGFTKWQLPVFLEKGSLMYISIGAPGVSVPEHSHDEGDGMRFIAAGSIEYHGKELHAGDWMFLPAGTKYSFTVGPTGATMFYCYSCCCGETGPCDTQSVD